MKTCVIGASGYTGAELCRLLANHPLFELSDVYVSSGSADAHKLLSDLHGQLAGTVDLPLQPLEDEALASLANDMDLIFLATPHEASHDWMPVLTSGKAKILDLSGAFRIKHTETFKAFYGFDHMYTELLSSAVYGLADWHAAQIADARLIAVPGCYPTAALTALKPLFQNGLLDDSVRPIINAVSGVSGAGRKAALSNSFCEVSLQAYGVLQHRHTPEIEAYLGCPVIFTPHLGNFKRGILATITAKLAAGISAKQVNDAYYEAYAKTPIVRMRTQFPKLDDVVGSPYCDLHWKYDPQSRYLVVTSAIDNLLKGAASQAMQCANIVAGLPSHQGLVSSKQDGAL
ncbi:N-acetyl-gamma-glutamyl-phosphate reductase [Aestuariibacter salexigens]|uniref:N-acetyl-gamma-glutamyl-phosphate reductase n=1 Tax=Aestuariibacter salexigens TaxID=226010 RepID=UPI000414DF00|nr:N-acetyl-gamma-glutamyl-phosphate reductase [Aestuariibacter salexigens]